MDFDKFTKQFWLQILLQEICLESFLENLSSISNLLNLAEKALPSDKYLLSITENTLL